MYVVVQLLSHVRSFATPCTAAFQAPLSITISWSLLKLMSIESMMPSNHLTWCCPLLLLPSIFPSIRVFSNELALCIKWPKYWSFSFNTSPSNEYSNEHCLCLSYFTHSLSFFFLTWTIFKVFTEFVSKLLLLYNFVSWLQGIQDLSSPTRNWTPTSCIGRWSLFHWIIREVPLISLLVRWFLTCLSDSLDVCDLESGERLEMENQKNGQKGGRKRRDQSLSQW